MRHRRKRILKRRRGGRRRRAHHLPAWSPLRLDNPLRTLGTILDFAMNPSPVTAHALAHEIGACFGIDSQAVLSVNEATIDAADALIVCVVDVCRALASTEVYR